MGDLKQIAKYIGVDNAIERVWLPRSADFSINGHSVTYTSTQLFAYIHHRPDESDEFWLEGAVSRRFADFCESNDTVMDIGADHGFYSLLAATEVGAGGTVIAFEAHPRAAEGLRRNLSETDLDATLCPEEMAVSDMSGNVSFDHNSLSSGGEVVVPATTIDDYCATTKIRPGILKIDVEGAEEMVLKGGEKEISRSRPKMLIEIHSADDLGRFDSSQDAVYDWLLSHDYSLSRHENERDRYGTDAVKPPETGVRHHVFATPGR